MVELDSSAGQASTITDCEGLGRALLFDSGEDTTSAVAAQGLKELP